MTLLKRNLCYPDRVVVVEDIDDTTVFPHESKIPLTIDMIGKGAIEGVAWVEEHHTTWVPWILVLFFFWCITPTVTHKIFVLLEQNDMTISFDVEFDIMQTIHDNIMGAPKEFGIKEVWIHPND